MSERHYYLDCAKVGFDERPRGPFLAIVSILALIIVCLAGTFATSEKEVVLACQARGGEAYMKWPGHKIVCLDRKGISTK